MTSDMFSDTRWPARDIDKKWMVGSAVHKLWLHDKSSGVEKYASYAIRGNLAPTYNYAVHRKLHSVYELAEVINNSTLMINLS